MRIIVLLVCILPLFAQTTEWVPGHPPSSAQQSVPGNYNFRPQNPDNARRLDTAWPNFPYDLQPPIAHHSYPAPTSPELQVEISNSKPYVQQNVILTFRVLSVSSIKEIDPILPQIQGITFQALTAPEAHNIYAIGSSHRVATEMRYMVTPLAAGVTSLQLGAHVTTVDTTGKETKFTLNAPQTLPLDVQNQIAHISPWLPLEKLQINSNMQALPEVQPGQSITLIIQLQAEGMLGNQLPSIERQINVPPLLSGGGGQGVGAQSPDVRIYRGKTTATGGISVDRQHIIGIRTENYTLVPQYTGKLRLPPVRITWFNVRTGVIEQAILPITTAFADTNGTATTMIGIIYSLWIPLSLVLMLLMLFLGYWLGGYYHDTGLYIPPVEEWFPKLHITVPNPMLPLKRLLKRLNLGLHWYRISHRIAARLPIPLRLWLWVRSANMESTPTQWRYALQFLSWRTLAPSPYITSTAMVKYITQFQPSNRHEHLRQLFKKLDSATYGNQSIDFMQWKQDIARQINPNIGLVFGLFSVYNTTKRHHLPDLNPR